jgi:hypothetical protein
MVIKYTNILANQNMPKLGFFGVKVNHQANPGLDTILQVKALTAIASYESAYGVRKFSVPDKTALTSLATSSSGDIRAAVNALQFACLNGE